MSRPEMAAGGGPVYDSLMELSRLAAMVAQPMQAACHDAGEMILDAYRCGGKILACGNGGSAADAQHFVAEFVGRMRVERRPLAAVALSSDPSIVTALGNDYGYEKVFARQVEALGKTGDVLIGISTSGRSPNVLQALAAAQRLGLRTIALVGQDRAPAAACADLCISVPSRETPRIQEIHTAALHAICDLVEQAIITNSKT